MARILIVGGEDRGARLAASLLHAGYPVRTVVDARSGGASQREAPGVELFLADPERPGTLKAALAYVSVACWLFGSASRAAPALNLLNGRHLERFLQQTVDSSVRGVVYEATGSAPPRMLAEGRSLATRFGRRHVVPVALITADPLDHEGWLASAQRAVGGLLGSGTLVRRRSVPLSGAGAQSIIS